MSRSVIGMIGLGTMGRNLLLNMAEHGFAGVGYDLDVSKRELLLSEGSGLPVDTADSAEGLIRKLERPRNIILLVPAGPIVDTVIDGLVPHLDEGDLIIDGGNSHFTDTDRRLKDLAATGIGFMGMGISGGEAGARHGASIMPGGEREFYDRVEPVLRAVAAKVDGDPCVAYMGTGSAGHFVKMVHNGIEYGMMQLISETYDHLRRVIGMNYDSMSEIFADWNRSELNSFLMEITAEVLSKVDAESGRPLVEMILDKAAQKGTGKWTSQAAMDLGVPIPTIDSAVTMRQISAMKETRVLAAKKYRSLDIASPRAAKSGDKVASERQYDQRARLARSETTTIAAEQQKAPAKDKSNSTPAANMKGDENDSDLRSQLEKDTTGTLTELRKAILCSFVITYAQGMSLLRVASIEKGYGLDLADISRIWRGGCIIRSALLNDINRAYSASPDLYNLLLDDEFALLLDQNRDSWREVTAQFSKASIPAISMASALAYFDAFRSERLPANLIQAQRDYFGAHTYERIDKEGVFHTPDWGSNEENQ